MCALTWIKVPQWSLTSSVRKSGQIRTMCETGEIAAMEPDLIGQEKRPDPHHVRDRRDRRNGA